MDGIDHRWGDRVPVNIPVTLTARPGVRLTGALANVSVSGAWIETRSAPPGITLCRVSLPARRSHDVAADVMAWVVRRTDHGLAVEWCDLAPPFVRGILARSAPAGKPPALATPPPMSS